MGKLTSDKPKCMIELSSKETILSRQLRMINDAGLNSVVITTGYRDTELVDYCENLDLPIEYLFVKNLIYDQTNYIYSIYCAREYLDDDIILIHGDLVFDMEVFKRVINSPVSCMTVSSTLPLSEKDFKAQVIDGKVIKVGVDLFDHSMQAQALYKIKKDDWDLWLNKIIEFCESGKTKVYAENALNELEGRANISALDIQNLLCLEIDNLNDLDVVNNKLKNEITLLSIIIPTYNCEHFVSEGIDSVLSQLPENCELILVDDGSEDGTKNVLSSYEGRQDNLHIIYEVHRGASGARNTGLDRAKGKYVTFMDCDDCLKAGFLKRNISLLESDADLYIFGIERVLLDGSRSASTLQDREFWNISDFADEYIRTRAMLIYSNCNKFYKRSVIEGRGIRFDESFFFGEDRLFNYSFLMGAGSVVTSSEIMLEYIQRSLESMSTKYDPDYYDRIMKLHHAKVDCFTSLSKGTTEEEKKLFEKRDLESEIRKMEALGINVNERNN